MRSAERSERLRTADHEKSGRCEADPIRSVEHLSEKRLRWRSKSTTCKILTMKVTEKGQITIPKEIRDALGIGAGTEVEFERDKDTIVVRKASDRPTRGRQLAERLRGRGDVVMTTSEIMALTREP